MVLSRELLEILSCPKCNAKLDDKGDKVVCKECKRSFPVEDGVPNLIC